MHFADFLPELPDHARIAERAVALGDFNPMALCDRVEVMP
jgi:hypothetical protein